MESFMIWKHSRCRVGGVKETKRDPSRITKCLPGAHGEGKGETANEHVVSFGVNVKCSGIKR